MASLIEYFYKNNSLKSKMTLPKPVSADAGSEHIKITMETDLRDFARWISRVYGELSRQSQTLAMQKYEELTDQANQQLMSGDWAGFQETLTEAYGFFRSLQPPDNRLYPQGEHWTYQVWSRLLDAEVWFVCCQKEVSELAQKGIKRGSIYTQNELEELLSLSKPTPAAVKKIHFVKNCFDGVIASYH